MHLKMAAQMGILSYGIILTLTVLTVLLPILTTGNVIDQRVLQRELGENSPDIMSMSDKDDIREIEDPAVDEYSMKKREDQNLDMALIAEYIFAKQMMMNRLRARTDSFRPQKKRSYWKQCAFNAVSCFG